MTVDWKTAAIVEHDAKKFAEELELTMNNFTRRGYSLVQLMERRDSGLVLLFQKLVEPTAGSPES